VSQVILLTISSLGVARLSEREPVRLSAGFEESVPSCVRSRTASCSHAGWYAVGRVCAVVAGPVHDEMRVARGGMEPLCLSHLTAEIKIATAISAIRMPAANALRLRNLVRHRTSESADGTAHVGAGASAGAHRSCGSCRAASAPEAPLLSLSLSRAMLLTTSVPRAGLTIRT
jgi:hypothetical protein